MEANNNFSSGMNSDVSKIFQPNASYLQALNFRPLTELGNSNGSLVNIKGNECKLTFPDLQPVFKLVLTKGTNVLPAVTTNNVTFTINGVTASTFLTISNDTTGFDIYTFIINDVNFTNCYQYAGVPPVTPVTPTFAIAYEDNYVVFYQQPDYQDCTTIPSIITTVTTSYSQSTSGGFATLYFYNSGNNLTTGLPNPDTLVQDLVNPYILGFSSDLIIPIGSTFILNDIYILTAPDDPAYGPAGIDKEKPANDVFQTNGAIWKLTIDDITKQHTLTLIYSSNIDFTKYHPIPPSAITGRYESKDIKRIYWSDNYNKVRTLNVSMPQLMALRPYLTNVMPPAEFTQPILDSIIGGSLTSGSYQLAYRLSNVLGAVTNFSELSNPVYLTTSPESGTAFQDYTGNWGGTGKGIVWKITPSDLSYDQVETVVIYKSAENAVPAITSMGLRGNLLTLSIPLTDINATGYLPVTLEDFLLFSGTFTHAKTCDTKDNRLFWGNVRAPKQELTAFDARVFRANDDGIIRLKNNDLVTDNTLLEAIDRPQTDDCINEYYDLNGDYSVNACYLKPEPTGLPTKLGGRGVNISYEFGTEVFESDNMAGKVGDNWDWINGGSPYRTNSTTNTPPTDLIYTYPQNNKFQAMKQPERTSLLRGFQHEEIYRFGIQFFDLEQNPYFTQWIGDIKMPSYGDVNSNPGNPSYPDFRLSYLNAESNQIFSQILYVKFTVNVSSIQNAISGYQIVRVKREGTNKTIYGAGLITPMMSECMDDGGASIRLPAGWNSRGTTFFVPGSIPVPFITDLRYYTPFPDQKSVEILNLDDDSPSRPNFARFKTFDCFDFDAGNRPSHSSNDRLLIRSRLIGLNWKNSSIFPGAYRQWFGSPAKNYAHDSSPSGAIYVPRSDEEIDNGNNGPFITYSNNDSQHQPHYVFKLVHDGSYCNYNDFLTPNSNNHDYRIEKSSYVATNDTNSSFWTPPSGGVPYDFGNFGSDCANGGESKTGNPTMGKATLAVVLLENRSGSAPALYTSSAPYTCNTVYNYFGKLLALYYKPNSSLYGGATYFNRTENEYIPCGEYVPLIQNNLPTNFINKTYKVFGGDVFTVTEDMQKTSFPSGDTAKYYAYEFDTNGVFIPNFPNVFWESFAKYSSSFFYPSTSLYNSELRDGVHINRNLSNEGGYGEDTFDYQTYNNAENDTKKYYPKPLNFQTADEWINRIYWSEIKFNNETQDSWSMYFTDNFYDVEGNYGPINALVSLKENMYYIQERGTGMLMINPVSLINDQMGQPIKLGGGNVNDRVIQKHYYKAIDAGTSHQWSVYRSQSAISFVDVRHKKIYIFNGESVSPISDVKGQRNFVIKRLHNVILENDNPVIDKGILTTYDYYHNEFLYTFNNVDNNLEEDEKLTLAFSEISNEFTGMYSFSPNLYINNNKYIISTKQSTVPGTDMKLWFHNYGTYANFYGTQYDSTLKLLVNDNPQYTKVFDNLTLMSEAVNDNLEWNDDFNIYPGSSTVPAYPDDVNNKNSTFNELRIYNQYQNTDWVTLDPSTNTNIRKVEQGFNIQVPRNKFNYDTTSPSTVSIFDPTKLNKTTFGERIRDKWMVLDLKYKNLTGLRFVIHNIKTIFRISER